MQRCKFKNILLLGALLLCALESRAQTRLLSLVNPNSSASVNLKNTTFSSLRTEFRIENLSTFSAQRYVWGLGEFPLFHCSLGANNRILSCNFGGDSTPQGDTQVDLGSRSDVRVRWQRDYAGQYVQLEIWNGDCSGYSTLKRPISPVAPSTQSGHFKVGDRMTLGFLRLYSQLDLSGVCPIDAPPATADLLDLRFESIQGTGTLSDSSGRGQNLSASGSSFGDSTPYPPQARISGWTTYKPVFRAAEEFVLTAATSSVFEGNGSPTNVFWQQIDGPADSTIQSHTDVAPKITAPVTGQYTYQLTVKDNRGVEGKVQQIVGVVGTDPNYVVNIPDADFSWTVGSVIMHGKSPWPWYEITEAAVGDVLRPVMVTPPTEIPGQGTIKAAASNRIDAQGLITSEGTGNNGVAWTVTGATLDASYVGKWISLHWDADGDGSFKGRRVVYINQLLSPTTFLSNDYSLQEPAARLNTIELTWGLLGADYGPYNSSDPNSFIAMFYEGGLAIGRLAAKTGLQEYRMQFHTFCDNWWRYALGSGWAFPIPRNSGVHSMVACASDPTYNAPPGLWDGLARVTKQMSRYISTSAGAQVGYNPTSPVQRGTPDIREVSYILRSTSLLARLYGRRNGNYGTWCGYLKNQLNNLWLPTAAVPPGAPNSNYAFWPENLFLSNSGYIAASSPAGASDGVFGTSPWRSAGLPTLALIYAYEALADTTACNEPVLARQLFNSSDSSGVIPKAANYIWDFGRSPDGGVFYAEGYETDTGNTPGDTVFNTAPANGPIQVTNNSTAVVGTGTYFRAQFGPCNSGTQIKIQGATYGVSGCSDDEHLTLSTPFTGPSSGGIYDFGNPATISVTNGGVTVIGTGTRFTTLFAPCDGSTYIGIVGNANADVDRRVYQVTGCASDTSLTLNVPYAGRTESGLNTFARARRARQNCGPLSISGRCEPDRYNGRNLSADIAASSAWLYGQTGNLNWRSRAYYYANKTFGGPAGGAGAIGPPSGSCVYRRPGTISVTAGSRTVTGSGTEFTKQFGPCDGSTRITIADAAGAWSNPLDRMPEFNTYSVTACTDTSLTLSANYAGATRSSTGLFYSADDPQWQCADGATGNLGEILAPCQTSAPPCGAGALVPKYAKPLGMVSGAGDTPVMMGTLATGLFQPLIEQQMQIEFDMSRVPNAGRAKVKLLLPNGAVRESVCTSSPCSVPVNLRFGNPRVRIEYMESTGSRVLATGEPAMLRVLRNNQ